MAHTEIFIIKAYNQFNITSTSDLQPSTVIANQLPGQLASTEIRTIGIKFIIASVDSAQIKTI